MPNMAFREITSIVRLHIVLIAMAAAVVFGWLFGGEYLWTVALLGGLDWLLINLLNRITDTQEDVANEIDGAGHVARFKSLWLVCWCVLQAGSIAFGFWLWPALLTYRLSVQLIGVAYSYRIVPTLKGWRRLKDLYFLKNFMSSMLFVLTVFIYPLAALGFQVRLQGQWAAAGLLAAFFVTFEITYEILYDMRDLEGDRLAGVPTYPVVHGLHRSRQIVDALLLGSVTFILIGLVTGTLGVREALFVVAPALQFVFYRPRYHRGLTSPDCILLTHLGTAMLVVFLIGASLWLRVGLPENIFLVGG